MRYDFLVETYETERLKVLSVWSEFGDDELAFRPHPSDKRGRSVLEQMVHQCVSEDLWFRRFLGIDVTAPPLPSEERRLPFLRRYAEDSGKRLVQLRSQEPAADTVPVDADVSGLASGHDPVLLRSDLQERGPAARLVRVGRASV